MTHRQCDCGLGDAVHEIVARRTSGSGGRMSEVDYLRSVDYQFCVLTLTTADGVEITVNRSAIAFIGPELIWDAETKSFSKRGPGAVVNFGHSPVDGGLIVRESYDDIRRLMRGGQH